MLRDTDRMRAEALVIQHLGADLGDAAFWQDVIERLEPRVARFETMMNELDLHDGSNGMTDLAGMTLFVRSEPQYRLRDRQTRSR